MAATDFGEQLGGQAVSGVELTREEGAGLGVGILNGKKADSVQADVFRIPVVRVSPDFDEVVVAPFG